MASTMHQVPSFGVAGEELRDRKVPRNTKLLKDPSNGRASLSHIDLKHKVSWEQSLVDGRSISNWVHGDLRHREFTGGPCHDTRSNTQVEYFVAGLRACARNKDLVRGTSIHHELVQRQLLKECSDALITMYAQCGELATAKTLLDMHKSNDVVTWTTLIDGYARDGQGQNALDCFKQMQCEGILPNVVTYVCALKACATIGDAERGKEIHYDIARWGLLQRNIILGNALVDMYAKCGAVSEARQVLDELPSRDVVSWSALIAGYAQKGESEEALHCLEEMREEGIHPNAVTYICALKACAKIRAADKGKQIHEEVARQGLLQKHIVLCNALVDMYAKCGNVSEARRVLEELPSRNVVSWNSLIAGYAQVGHADLALSCLEQMQQEGILPSVVTYVCALKACATIRAYDRGKKFHDEITKQGLLQNNIVLGTTLVDLYSKCGAVSEAQWVLKELPSRDVVCWSALIAGYAQEGEAEQAMNCLRQMRHEGILPNAVTCACVLNVCNHRGLVEEGQNLFWNMSREYGVKPNLECYTSMIDLFGRVGHLEKAAGLIQQMPSSDDTTIWHTLLGACQRWADVNMGEWAYEQALKLDKSDESAYVLMANIFAAAGMEEKEKGVEAMRIKNKA